MEILKVENLSKIYGKDSTSVIALDHISFSVQKYQSRTSLKKTNKSNEKVSFSRLAHARM